MSIFGGGGGGGGGSSTGTQTSIAREAPGVEARKLALYDEAAGLATDYLYPLPGIQVAPLSALEQAGITQAGQTGVGAGTVTGGIGAFTGAQQTAAAGPNISQFLNPYQSYVTDEIGRQGQMMSEPIRSANASRSKVHLVVDVKVCNKQNYKDGTLATTWSVFSIRFPNCS
jgi:hypothetical protein